MTGRSPVWHPYTQHALQPDATLIARGEGAWLETPDSRRILDCISSWWVVTHGHRHPAIVAAIKDQADKLDQVIFAGFTHEPAEKLARKLIALANSPPPLWGRKGGGDHSTSHVVIPPTPSPSPQGGGEARLSHVFFSDSGSTSVEVALKMALGYWHNRGEPRHRIVALEHGYHGDTIGTMSAGARGVFNAAYEPLLFDVVRIPFPHAGREEATLGALDFACRTEPIAALILEPLILGAGGMLTYPASVLAELRRLCKAHGALFIADEVMTGWGRTGTMFASEQAGITPDILCLAKGLTGGSLPLATTLCTPEIFEAHLSEDRAKTFFHSSSYTANPICCAAALANIGVWETEPVRERIAALAALQADRIAPFAGDPRFASVRQLGTITALDLAVEDAGYLAGAGPKLQAFFLGRGLLLRPLGNTIYVMPPYCITAPELDLIYEAISDAAALA